MKQVTALEHVLWFNANVSLPALNEAKKSTPRGLPSSTPVALRRWGPRAWGRRLRMGWMKGR